MESAKSRLTKSDYLRRGLDVLAAEGPRSLTAARMARELNVTKGSFYWHFESVDSFRDDLKRFWHDDVVIAIITEAKKLAKDPGDVLEEIGRIVRQRRTHRYDTAMRCWAEFDRDVQEVVRSADRVRRDLITKVLRGAGVDAEHANDRASLLGAAWLGSQDLDDPDHRFRLISLVIAPHLGRIQAQ